MQQDAIDTEWFLERLRIQGKTRNDLARMLGIDKSAISRLLRGERKMSADEQDVIADVLGVTLQEIAAHRGVAGSGFGESKQAAYFDGKEETELEKKATARHPIFGCMKGTMTIPSDLDLTAPVDEVEWSEKLYNE